MTEQHTPRIFLCHASEDKPKVKKLYRQLKEAGYHPWLDQYDLIPGQNWRREIRKLITHPYNVIVVCLSQQSTTKRGVVQQEIKWALDILDQMPEDVIYLIPARLEPCQTPERLSSLHWVNLFEPDGFDNLKRALDFELSRRQPEAEPKSSPSPSTSVLTSSTSIFTIDRPIKLEMILIPAGEFLMGSVPAKDSRARDNEQPQNTVYLPDYYIAKTLVTNAQYAAFVQATNHEKPGHWKNGNIPTGKDDHPVVYVSWTDAIAFCRWLANETGKPFRLLTEAEWEKAARGSDGRIYPWGNAWDATRCNTRRDGPGDTTPVGTYLTGSSPYGVLDMAGNVLEWCATKWEKSYPYDAEEDEWTAEYLEGTNVRALRGGSWRYGSEHGARCAARDGYYDDYRSSYVGFRMGFSPK